jgi:hypothetical protein
MPGPETSLCCIDGSVSCHVKSMPSVDWSNELCPNFDQPRKGQWLPTFSWSSPALEQFCFALRRFITVEDMHIDLFNNSHSETIQTRELGAKIVKLTKGVALGKITWDKFPDGFPNIFVHDVEKLKVASLKSLLFFFVD